MGPGHDFGDQIKYVENTWPYNFSLNIIKAESDPECHTGGNSIAYCNVKVVNIDSLYLRWDRTNLSSPNTVFTLHYWYITGNTKFRITSYNVCYTKLLRLSNKPVSVIVYTA